MPAGVLGIETVPAASGGGFRILTSNRGVIELYRDNVPGNIRNRSAAEVEAWANNWLEQRLTYVDDEGLTKWVFYAQVSVTSTSPLVATITMADEPPVV